MRILVSAYACEPGVGSEQGVGYNWTRQLAAKNDVWVLTRANNRAVLEEALQREPVEGLTYIYFDLPNWLRFWKRGGRGVYPYYLLWQLGAYWLARRAHREHRFDIVHHLTFGNLFYPTLLPLLGAPFVWGPVGGGEGVPAAFRAGLGLGGRLKEGLRDQFTRLLAKSPLHELAFRRAALIIAKSEDTAALVPKGSANKTVVMTDVAAEPRTLAPGQVRGIQIVAVGSLVYWRGFDLLLRAFVAVAAQQSGARLLILGDGPERRQLERLRDELGLAEQACFAGRVEHQAYLRHLADSTMLVNPCLKEGGVTTIFDALAMGLPIICLDVAGTPCLSEDDEIIKIPVTEPATVVKELEIAMLRVIEEPELLERMRRTGRELARSRLTWAAKGKQVNALFERIMAGAEEAGGSAR